MTAPPQPGNLDPRPCALEATPVRTDNFNRFCEELLVTYNKRKTAAVTRQLERLYGFLRDPGHSTVQTMFGGSVRKGTFVNSLSDIDVLLTVADTSLANRPPSQVIAYVWEPIRNESKNLPTHRRHHPYPQQTAEGTTGGCWVAAT